MEEIKFCPHCGHPNKTASNYCEKCGTPLSTDVYNHDPLQDIPMDDAYTKAPNEAPLYVKTKTTILNYSQTLRRMLFINRMPLIIALVLFLICVGDAFIPFIFNNFQPSPNFYLGLGLIALSLLYLAFYLIYTPLKTISMAKHSELDTYLVSFYNDRLHYQVTLTYRGRSVRNDFFIPYDTLIKVKEYKDMMLLGFAVQGQLIPLCFVKNEEYDNIIKFFQSRINQIQNK